MAIQTIPGGVLYPPFRALGNGVALTQVATLNADTAKACFVIQPPKTGNIRKVRVGTRTITAGGTTDVRIETIDAATGHPSGTLWGATTNGSQVVLDGDDNVWFTTTLTADAAVTDVSVPMGIVVQVATGFNGALLSAWALNSGVDSIFPYFRMFNGTSWAGTGSGYPMVMLEYDDGTYEHVLGCFPAGNVTTPTVSTSTTPDVIGAHFQVPWPCRVRGAWVQFHGSGDAAIRLVTTAYNQGAGTGILASCALDKDIKDSAGTMLVQFDAPVTLAKATWYRLILEPTSTTAINGPYDIEVPSLAGLDAWASNWHLTTAKDPTVDGDWTNYNSGTFRTPPLMGLIIDGFDDATAVSIAPNLIGPGGLVRVC